jgi:hypothetical protein
MTTRTELPRTGRIESTSEGRRRRNIIKGEGMVTPVEGLLWSDDYVTREPLKPGRTRLTPDHPAVRRNPELFRPCMKGDRVTADRMENLLRHAERQELREIARMRGGIRVAARPRTSWRLPDPPSEPWRLP